MTTVVCHHERSEGSAFHWQLAKDTRLVPHTFAVFECVGDQDGSYELPGREKANPTHSNGRNEWAPGTWPPAALTHRYASPASWHIFTQRSTQFWYQYQVPCTSTPNPLAGF